MQAWTSIKVSDPTHPRAGQAGVCQGAPYTVDGFNADEAAKLEEQAQHLEALTADATAALDALSQSVSLALNRSLAAREAANEAAAAAAGQAVDQAERVRVKFDQDDAVLSVRVDQLEVLR